MNQVAGTAQRPVPEPVRRRWAARVALLRQLCVERRRWLDDGECNLLPGPASTQLAIFCAWRVRGRVGALAGGSRSSFPAWSSSRRAGPGLACGLVEVVRQRPAARAQVSMPLAVAGAAAVAFTPSFAFIGSAVPLAMALQRPWQYAVLAGAAALLLLVRRGVVLTPLMAGAVGVVVALAGVALPQ